MLSSHSCACPGSSSSLRMNWQNMARITVASVDIGYASEAIVPSNAGCRTWVRSLYVQTSSWRKEGYRRPLLAAIAWWLRILTSFIYDVWSCSLWVILIDCAFRRPVKLEWIAQAMTTAAAAATTMMEMIAPLGSSAMFLLNENRRDESCFGGSWRRLSDVLQPKA
jgi:hypothetical protein